ncbi:MAG: hypothetical protein J7502_02155 [Flavisolibacter sp.]|nr:hypothetical protein [Flavisolibacter sp.]
MKRERTALYNKLYKLHLRIVKELNNSHLFVQKVIPLIQEEVDKLNNSTHKDDRVYHVPARKGKFYNTEAFRTDLELKHILYNIAEHELYENLLVTNISKFEGYIFKSLNEVIEAYPEKLQINIAGISSVKNVPIEVVLSSSSHKEILSYLIKEKLVAISYAKPNDYLKFIEQALSVKLENNECFQDYIEMKATRDLIVHNSGIINDVYIVKSGKKGRGSVGERIIVDKSYFDMSIGTMKRISGIIKRDTEKKFNSPSRGASSK